MALKTSLSIRAKLVSVFVAISLSLILGGALVFRTLQLLSATKKEQSSLVNALGTLKEIEQFFADANLLGMDILVDYFEEPNRKVVRVDEFDALVQDLQKVKSKWIEEIKDVQESERLEKVMLYIDEIIAGIKGSIDTINNGVKDKEQYAKYDEMIDGSKVKGGEVVSRIRDNLRTRFVASQETMEKQFRNLFRSVIIVFVGATFVLLFLATPIIVKLSKDLSLLQNRLSQIVQSMETSSSSLRSTSHQLAESASRTTETIHESVSSMTEMSAMLAQTSRNTMATADLSRDVLEQSQQGVSVMSDMSHSMRNITDSSSRLREIVQVIDNISTKTNVINDVVFKTQLLAVNASIEAARAGHHGKGFSVVANEVASLAALSGKASGEIRELLQSSAQRVQEIIEGTSVSIKDGEATSERSSSAFNQIAKSVSLISDKVDQITVASREQEVSVAQNSTALTTMNKTAVSTNEIAQRNSSLSQEIAQLASQLQHIEKALCRITVGKEKKPSSGINANRNRSHVLDILEGEVESTKQDQSIETSSYKKSA